MAPSWVLVMSALLTPTVALAVGVVAFLQWRTANDKLALDLFERRYAILREVDHAIFAWFSDEDDTNTLMAIDRVERAGLQSEFLFGEEVTSFIRDVHVRLCTARKIDRRLSANGLSAAERDELGDKRSAIYSQIEDDRAQLAILCRPYMRMDRKVVRTPKQWFHDRNEIRKSFDDRG